MFYQSQACGANGLTNLVCGINVSAEKIFWSNCIGIWAEVGAKFCPLLLHARTKYVFRDFCRFLDSLQQEITLTQELGECKLIKLCVKAINGSTKAPCGDNNSFCE